MPGHTQETPVQTAPDLRLGEAAGILKVHPETLRRWADEGKVPSVRTPGGERRFRREDIALVYADSPAVTAAEAPTEGPRR